MRKKSWIIILVLAIIFGGAFFLGMFTYLISSPVKSTNIFSKGNVGLVTVEGGIFEPRETVEELDKYRKDDDIKAVVIRIESPGGTVAASQEIFNAIKRLAAKKPVVASMGSVAASGGYYIACATTKIMANPATITGSIGVRMDHLNLSDLMRWAKVRHETLKSGKFKDIASPDRALTPEERAILEEILANMHDQFKNILKETRGFDDAQVQKVSDGRIFTGQEAKDLGLIDELGGLFDAVKLAGELAKIKGEPDVVEKYKPKHKWMMRLFESMFSQMQSFASSKLLYQSN